MPILTNADSHGCILTCVLQESRQHNLLGDLPVFRSTSSDLEALRFLFFHPLESILQHALVQWRLVEGHFACAPATAQHVEEVSV